MVLMLSTVKNLQLPLALVLEFLVAFLQFLAKHELTKKRVTTFDHLNIC